MKRIALSVTIASVAVLSPVAGYSQTETRPATTAGGTATGEKKAALSSNDKNLVKAAGETQTGLKHLAEVANANSPASESVKALGKKVTTELTPAWGDLDTAIKDKGAELPKTDQTPGEKRDIAEMRKLKD